MDLKGAIYIIEMLSNLIAVDIFSRLLLSNGSRSILLLWVGHVAQATKQQREQICVVTQIQQPKKRGQKP